MWIFVCIGLALVVVAIIAYCYVDYMSGRYLGDIYNGLRNTFLTLGELLDRMEDEAKRLRR